jgi:hypothetical protein
MTITERQIQLRKRLAGFKHNDKEIIDELCNCGHQRSTHLDHFDIGHGQCTKCNCRKFTWVKFITN